MLICGWKEGGMDSNFITDIEGYTYKTNVKMQKSGFDQLGRLSLSDLITYSTTPWFLKYGRKALLIRDNPRFVLPYLEIT